MAIKLISPKPEESKPRVKRMSEMEPLEVCVNVKTNTVVMRTAHTKALEVMDLSDPGGGKCWIGLCFDFEVRELREGEKYILELS